MQTIIRNNRNGKHPDSEVHPTPVDYWRASDYTTETPLEMLEARTKQLLEREGNAFDAGVTCGWKDLPDMSCSACPMNEIGQGTRKAPLCRLGREQERIAALTLVKRHDDTD